MSSLLFAAALLAVGPAQCSEAAFFERPDAVRLVRVTSDGRAPMTPADCAPDACPSRAYLVKGDTLLASHASGEFACVWFKPKPRPMSNRTIDPVNPEGLSTVGWVKLSSLAPAPRDDSRRAWRGQWVGTAVLIEIGLPDDPRLLMIRGQGFNRISQADADRGRVNVGHFAARFPVQGVRAGGWIDDGDVVRTTPMPERASCAFTFHRYGDYMLVEELSVCGGMGVRFQGVYRRDGSVQPGPVLKAPWDED